MNSANWLKSICEQNNLQLNALQLELLESYVGKLKEWNSKLNLISRRDEENIWLRHILPSIALLFDFRLHLPSRLIDIGTGGGLPGIPLAILQTQLEVTLLDSIQKKITAVKDILTSLSLKNADATCARAEELVRTGEFRSSYDYVIARAVGPLENIVRWGKPFLKHVSNDGISVLQPPHKTIIPTGSIIMLKGGDLQGEIEATQKKLPTLKIFSYPVKVAGIDPEILPDKKIVITIP